MINVEQIWDLTQFKDRDVRLTSTSVTMILILVALDRVVLCVAGYALCQLSLACPKHLSSTCSPAARPVLFKTQLQNLERQEGQSASLRCETTKPGASVVWRCGDRVLASSSKYHLKQEGTIVELVIYKLQGADAGEYSCDTGNRRTSAVLTVQGRSCLSFSLSSGVTSSHTFYITPHLSMMRINLSS